MLKLLDVEASYGRGPVLKGVSLEVGPGEIVALLGSNGAGKSTTLRVISGLLHPSAGSIHFYTEAIHRLAPHEILRRGICHVPEGRQLFPHMTVLENLEMGALRANLDRSQRDARISEMCEYFPVLAERRRQRAGTLSGGEQQMLAIARGLMSGPQMLLLDEPSLGLAPLVVDTVFDTIQQLHRRGLTILLVEQNAGLALEIADRAYVLTQGVVTLVGKGRELLGSDLVRKAYLGV